MVSNRSAIAIFAIKRFVTRLEDFFNTTNKPKELPKKAIKKVTAYADVKPIWAFDDK